MNNLIVNALLSTVNQTEGEKMTINDYLTLAALIIIPIVAVVIAQLLTTLIVGSFVHGFDFMSSWTFLWFILFAIIACCCSIALKRITGRVSLNVNPRFV